MSGVKVFVKSYLTNILEYFIRTSNNVILFSIGIERFQQKPAADIGMMGYANPSQSARGIHTRLFSRAYIFKSGNEPPVVFVSADIGMVDQGIKTTVVVKLQKHGGIFNSKNVLLSGTHTHSGPGAYNQYLMYGITSLGFNKASFNAIVDGMVQSIDRAYANMKPGRVFISKGRVENANINRSPTAHDANPFEERQRYNFEQTDKDMTLLRIEDAAGNPLGSINWFPVHTTSMNNTNRLLSGDNKGYYASMLFENKMNPGARPGKEYFVAAFSSSNLGDVSPNIEGPRCIDTGLPCDNETSTCCNKLGICTFTNCIAFGPGKNGDMEESTEIIGQRQFDEAIRLFENQDGKAEQLKGPVHFVHQYVNMTNYEVNVTDPISGEVRTKSTCPGALGYSFAAGTTDGPGMFGFIKVPPAWLLDCHSPKPILLAVGLVEFPYEWVASIVETQMLRIGNLYLVAIPGELTTMSGRRLRKAVEEVIMRKIPTGPTPHVVIAGLSNVYTHYIATLEEYKKQRYGGASRLYGPYTLDAYMKQYSILTESMIDVINEFYVL